MHFTLRFADGDGGDDREVCERANRDNAEYFESICHSIQKPRKFFRYQLLKVPDYENITRLPDTKEDLTFKTPYSNNLYTEASRCAILNETSQERATELASRVSPGTNLRAQRRRTPTEKGQAFQQELDNRKAPQTGTVVARDGRKRSARERTPTEKGRSYQTQMKSKN